MVRLEAELVEIDASVLCLLCHPSEALRLAALEMAAATRALFLARKVAYDAAVSDRRAVLASALTSSSAADAGDAGVGREIAELEARMHRVERVEDFVGALIEREWRAKGSGAGSEVACATAAAAARHVS